MKYRVILAALLLAALAGCSSSDGDGGGMLDVAAPGVPAATAPGVPAAGQPTVPSTGVPAVPSTEVPAVTTPGEVTPVGDGAAGAAAPGTGLPAATSGPISAECQGFSFDGLVYSPGGTTLPNSCEAFHPTYNNPYAVRCVDAWPWYDSGFPGDEFCILPPPPDKGVQLGHHPQGALWFDQVSQGDMSGYQNPGTGWTLPSGGEEERNINVKVDTTGGNFYRTYVRMRAGSHHMIVSIGGGGQLDTWGPGGADGLFSGTGLPGAQRPDDNVPQTLEKPAEDAGLYRVLPANPTVTYNMHHFNSTAGPILKEAWQNFWWEGDATIQVRGIVGVPITQVATLSVAPGATTDLHYAATISSPTRILSLNGHRHAWTTNFSSWVQRQGGDTEIVYQSFDWFDQPTYLYNSQTDNPVPNPTASVDGGASGQLILNAGDQLHFNCHIEYTNERAASEGATLLPAENGTLRFANEAFTGEMCLLFGSAAASVPGFNASGAPPGFATGN